MQSTVFGAALRLGSLSLLQFGTIMRELLWLISVNAVLPVVMLLPLGVLGESVALTGGVVAAAVLLAFNAFRATQAPAWRRAYVFIIALNGLALFLLGSISVVTALPSVVGIVTSLL